jgi:hypothetical protein
MSIFFRLWPLLSFYPSSLSHCSRRSSITFSFLNSIDFLLFVTLVFLLFLLQLRPTEPDASVERAAHTLGDAQMRLLLPVEARSSFRLHGVQLSCGDHPATIE